jgi:hypothetical protein
MIARRWIVFLLATVAVGVVALRKASQAGDTLPAPQPGGAPNAAGTSSATRGFVGLAGCSARGCHGRSEPVIGQRVRQDEFSSTLAHDRHLHAYAALLSDRGKAIATKLDIEKRGIKAHEDVRCLACHTIPQLADAPPSEEVLGIRQEGVSCEACHGAAGKPDNPWLYRHTGNSEKKRDGMTLMTDMKVQAEVCAGCHVGAPAANNMPARDCNHDIMAAGHPPLNFELSAFRENLPPHWNIESTERKDIAYRPRVWAIGQVVSAKASVDLLADRAGKPTWPEFAAYACYSCHADLQHPSWRQAPRRFDKRRPGSLLYNTWYSAALPVVAAHTAPADRDLLASFHSIGQAMSQGTPAGKTTADKAHDTSKLLGDWLKLVEGAKFSKESILKMRQTLVGKDVPVETLNWDDVEQIALAAAALSQDDDALRESLRELFGTLTFPDRYESPHGYPHAKGLKEAFKEVVELLHK